MDAHQKRLSTLPLVRREKLAAPSAEPLDWPDLEGQIVLLFTSRVGSTFLCREVERTREVVRVGETFNETPLKTVQARWGLPTLGSALVKRIRGSASGRWFVAKAGVPGLCVAEHLGAIEHYIARTHFILLLRRDLAAQAISIETAGLSGQYHSSQPEARTLAPEDFNEGAVVDKARNILRGCTALGEYLDAAARPTRLLFYEDFRDGDFAGANAMLDDIGLPLRSTPASRPPRDLKPVTRSVSADWADRLRRAPSAATLFENYDKFVDEAVAKFG